MNKELLDGIARNSVMSHKNFSLFRSGEKGSDFFDMDKLVGDLRTREAVWDEIVDRIGETDAEYDKLVFLDKDYGPVGLLVFATELSNRFDTDLTVLKLWENLRFDELKVKGSPIGAGDSCLVVDDVINTGRTQKRAIELVERQGGDVAGLFCFYARDPAELRDIETEDGVTCLEPVLTHRKLDHLGLAMTDDIGNLLTDDYVEEFVSVLEDGPDAEMEAVLEAKLDAKVAETLERAAREADVPLADSPSDLPESVKQSLRNLYLHGSLFLNQEDVYSADD